MRKILPLDWNFDCCFDNGPVEYIPALDFCDYESLVRMALDLVRLVKSDDPVVDLDCYYAIVPARLFVVQREHAVQIAAASALPV